MIRKTLLAHKRRLLNSRCFGVIEPHNLQQRLQYGSQKIREYQSSSVRSTDAGGRDNTNNIGLFSLRDLHQAQDFAKLANTCIERCNSIRKELRDRLTAIEHKEYIPNLSETKLSLLLLDEISNEVCRVIDAAELCRNVHTNIEYRNAAEEVFSTLSAYISQLNADIVLYRMVCGIIDGPVSLQQTTTNNSKNDCLFDQLTEEQQLVALDLRSEFEAGGVHIGLLANEPGPEQETYRARSLRLSQLQDDVTHQETLFMQNAASNDNYAFLIGPFGRNIHDMQSTSAEKVVNGIREQDLAYGRNISNWLSKYVVQDTAILDDDQLSKLQSNANSNGASDTKSWIDTLTGKHSNVSTSLETNGGGGLYAIGISNKHVSKPLLASLPQSAHRQQVWSNSIGQPISNRHGLGGLVRTRQILAKELGYKSYAEKQLAKSVVGTESDVWDFLVNASNIIKLYAKDDINILYHEKINEIKKQQNLSGQKYDSLNSWDIPYLSHVARAQNIHKMNTNTRSYGSPENASTLISEYFPLSVAIHALRDITESLFNLKLIQTNLSPNESWLQQSSWNANVSNNDNSTIMKLIVQTPDGAPKGTVYLDLHTRQDKFTGAAHFTVQCGCSHSNQGSGGEDGQLPITALVFNFPTTATNASSEQHLLTLHELTTLFHEWGHAMHSLLSNTTYQHLSGTRGTLDFVEVPSHLFEAYANDIRCLKRWAKHYNTGLPPPDDLIEDAILSKNNFESIDVSTQILYSLVDQYIFGTKFGDIIHDNKTMMSDQDIYNRVVAMSCQLQTEHTLLPLATDLTGTTLGKSFTQYPCVYLPSHSHFVTYGGGYYAYLYAKMAAAHIWNHNFVQDPFDRRSGAALYEKMLVHGVARSPQKMLLDLCGGNKVDPTHYFKAITSKRDS
jgi:Zn-dependent oligopeptidase